MIDWPDQEAEAIVNIFVADQGPDHLLRLHQAIADALRTAYEKVRNERPAD